MNDTTRTATEIEQGAVKMHLASRELTVNGIPVGYMEYTTNTGWYASLLDASLNSEQAQHLALFIGTVNTTYPNGLV